MTTQELLILSFFDKNIPRKIDHKTLTTQMLDIGIGSNDSADYPFYNLIHQLKNKRLLVLYKDPSKIQKGITRATGPELLVLSDEAVQILQREEAKRNHDAFATELEFNKLKIEHDLLTKQLSDYNKTKSKHFGQSLFQLFQL